MKHIIVIDDTGSPGNKNETRFIKKNRKTLVGVFIHSQYIEHLEMTMKKNISIWNTEYGISEIHLTDLINRQKIFSNLPEDIPLVITKILSDWFSKIELPFIVQTCTNKTFLENGFHLIAKEKRGKLDPENARDQALFLMLFQIRKFMNEFYPNDEIEIVIDEDAKHKPNTVEIFKMLEGWATNSGIRYASSKEFVLLQIADFFAYALNRTQMAITKDNKTESEYLLYKYFTNVLSRQYSVGIAVNEGNLNNYTKDDYDYYQLTQRQIDGNLNSWLDIQDK
jgi:hypothetical protein